MEKYTLVGLRELDFEGSDGKPVKGFNLYFTFEDENIEGVGTDKIFVSADRFAKLTYVPSIGGQCHVLYNKYGKVTDLIQV